MSKGMKNNNPRGQGGKRKGAGRPSEALKDYIDGLVKPRHIVKRFYEIGFDRMNGKKMSDEIQYKALKELMDRRFGRVTEKIEHSGKVGLEGLLCEDEDAEDD